MIACYQFICWIWCIYYTNDFGREYDGFDAPCKRRVSICYDF